MGSISQNDAYIFWGVFTHLFFCSGFWLCSGFWVRSGFWVGVFVRSESVFCSFRFCFSLVLAAFLLVFPLFVVKLYFFLDSVWWFWFCAYFCSAHLMCRDRVFGRVPPRGRLSLASFFYLFQNLFVFEIEEYPFIKFPANFCQRFVIGNVMWRKFKDYRIRSLFFKGFTGIYNPQNDGVGFFKTMGFISQNDAYIFWGVFTPLFFALNSEFWVRSDSEFALGSESALLFILSRCFCSFWVGAFVRFASVFHSFLLLFRLFLRFLSTFLCVDSFFLEFVWWFWFCAYFCGKK